MRNFFLSLLAKLNLAKLIATHVAGKKHSIFHRRIAGIVVIVLGVIIAKIGGSLPIVGHVALDALGYGLHGIGLIPFISEIEKL